MKLTGLLSFSLWLVLFGIVNGEDCFDPESAIYQCSYGTYAVDLGVCQSLTDDDFENISECLDTVGRGNVNLLSLNDGQFTTLPSDLLKGLINLSELSFDRTTLKTLPDNLFTDEHTGLGWMSIVHSAIEGFPVDVFSALVALQYLYLGGNNLTTLPAGVFNLPILKLLGLRGNDDLQCLPETPSSTEVYLPDGFEAGTCVCSPVESVMCESGSICHPGDDGYTCDAGANNLSVE